MNEIFGANIAAIVNRTFKGNLHPLTLHKITRATDAYGSPSLTEFNHNGEGVRLSWDTRLAVARGYPIDAAKILILQNGIPQPSNDDEITILGTRFRIVDTRSDPVNASWTCAGVAIAHPAYDATQDTPSDWP